MKRWQIVLIAAALGMSAGILAGYVYRLCVPYTDNLSVAAVAFVTGFLVAVLAVHILMEK